MEIYHFQVTWHFMISCFFII